MPAAFEKIMHSLETPRRGVSTMMRNMICLTAIGIMFFFVPRSSFLVPRSAWNACNPPLCGKRDAERPNRGIPRGARSVERGTRT